MQWEVSTSFMNRSYKKKSQAIFWKTFAPKIPSTKYRGQYSASFIFAIFEKVLALRLKVMDERGPSTRYRPRRTPKRAREVAASPPMLIETSISKYILKNDYFGGIVGHLNLLRHGISCDILSFKSSV